ncbi:MAG: HypC/HybG/HupF family hydrogenase formation chaperone [Lachnospira sp.]
MCVALPGKIISIDNGIAVVDFNGNKVNADTGLVDVKAGDYCLVHAGCILQKVDETEALDLIDLMEEVKAFS